MLELELELEHESESDSELQPKLKLKSQLKLRPKLKLDGPAARTHARIRERTCLPRVPHSKTPRAKLKDW